MNDDEILEKTIVSLDEHTPETAEKIIQKWKYKVHSFKVNHILYSHIGKNHRNIFCDYKLYDIPNTMCKVIENLIDTGADMVTINMNNNIKSMEAISQYAEDIKLLGVTVLTSWDHNDPYFIHKQQIGDMYERSLWMMEKYGFWGMICSAKDIKMFKKTKLKKITPGIRFSHDMLGDQVRVTTPEKAIRNGSDYLVMGRSFFTNFENVKEENDKA
jgi:orotidine-5'-phosphate decarboxylase